MKGNPRLRAPLPVLVLTFALVHCSIGGRALAAERFGWHELSDGGNVLLMPSAKGGVYLADFANNSSRHFTFDELEHQEIGKRLAQAPYQVREVSFGNGATALSGVLFAPPKLAPHPGIVVIHGSGDSDRDNMWYLTIVDRLVRGGFAILLPDKRGCGKSSGEWESASFKDFAHDAIAGVDLLKRESEVDSGRIGLLGISQGGWIAPLAATLDPDITFVVNLCGSAVTPNEQLLHESIQTMRKPGERPNESMGRVAAAMAKRRRPEWWKKNGDFDPITHWKSVTVPSLIVYGADDELDNVPVSESMSRLDALVREAGKSNFTVKVYEGSGHDLADSATGRLREDFLEYLVNWSGNAGHGRR